MWGATLKKQAPQSKVMHFFTENSPLKTEEILSPDEYKPNLVRTNSSKITTLIEQHRARHKRESKKKRDIFSTDAFGELKNVIAEQKMLHASRNHIKQLLEDDTVGDIQNFVQFSPRVKYYDTVGSAYNQSDVHSTLNTRDDNTFSECLTTPRLAFLPSQNNN